MNTFVNTLLLLIGVALCVFAWFINNYGILDIHLNNSYFVLSQWYLFIVLGLLFACFGLGYTILEYLSFPINKTLKWISLGLLISSVFIMIMTLVVYYKFSYPLDNFPPNRYYRFDTFQTTVQMTRWWRTLTIMVIASLLMLPVSLILSIINWIRAVMGHS